MPWRCNPFFPVKSLRSNGAPTDRNLSEQTCNLHLCKQEGSKNLEQHQEAQDGNACCTKHFGRVGIAGGIGTGDRNARDSEGNSGTEANAME